MSKESNPTLIGAFVIGAVALLAIGAATFGAGEIFKEKGKYVTYFDGSVQGLRIGSNVAFRGVRVGAVTDMELIADMDTLDVTIRVEFETERDAFRNMVDGKVVERETALAMVSLPELIEAGLRSKLVSESLVTGQLLIDLDFDAESKAIMRGQNDAVPEIPSVPSNIQQALKKIEAIVDKLSSSEELQKLFIDTQEAVAGINELSNSEDIRETLAGLNALINSPQTQQLPGQLDGALQETQTLMQNTNTGVLAVTRDLETTLAAAEAALLQANNALQDDSALSYQLNNTLIEIAAAAKSLRILSEYLQQHPEALLSGKDDE